MIKGILMVLKMSWREPIFKLSIIFIINGTAYIIIESMYGKEVLNYMVEKWYSLMFGYAILYAIYLKRKEKKHGTSTMESTTID